ncbi:MAG: GAF domain-containing protein [Anaerolineae bacterium]|nr:GAF domain-containing protein [Anaerolineae bacterium]
MATVLRPGDQFRVVAEIARHLHGFRDCTLLLREAVGVLCEHFDLNHVYVYLLEESTRDLVVQAGSVQAEETRCQLDRIPLDHGESPVARTARAQKAVLIGDDGVEPAPAPDTCSRMVVPLAAGGQFVGVLDLRASRPGCFDQTTLAVLSLLADHIAVAVQNTRLLMEVQETVARLREAERRTNGFLASMSHKLRTPLNSILGYAEFMLMDSDGRLPREVLQDVQAIYDNGQSLLHSIGIIEQATGLVEVSAQQVGEDALPTC